MFLRPLRRIDPFAAVIAVFGLTIGIVGIMLTIASAHAGIGALIAASLIMVLAAAVDRAVRS